MLSTALQSKKRSEEKRMRVNELAKELKVDNKELLEILNKHGIKKTHSSNLEDSEEKLLRKAINAPTSSEEESPKKTPNVIIRRKQKSDTLQKTEEKAPQTVQAVSKDETKTADNSQKSATKNENFAEQKAEKISTEKNKQKRPEQPKARIIRPADSPAVKIQDIKKDEKPLERKKVEIVEIKAKDIEPKQNTKTKSVEPEKATQKSATKIIDPKAKEKTEEKNIPQARIISRPIIIEKPQPMHSEFIPEQPDMPKTSHSKNDFFKKNTQRDEEETLKKKKVKSSRKKDKRIVEAAELYQDNEDVLDLWSEKENESLGRPQQQRKRPNKKNKKQTKEQTPVTQPLRASKRKIRMEDNIRLGDLAQQLGVKTQEIIKLLFNLGIMATINQTVDLDTATLIASEYNFEVESFSFNENSFLLTQEADTNEQLKPRPPVVTIMGHVDHGKTSLLDAIRQTSVTKGEAGGITQHIGAYHVQTSRGEIVFLDTPGHEAFTAMRARGAEITDLVILVVAADDGVMEQTREAVSHSKAAGVPIVVAVNKIDKEGANPDRIKRELAEIGLTPEDWGGDTIFSEVSAKTGKGLEDLLELVALQAEVLDLKANPDKRALGHIIEAKLDKGRGPVATVLVQEGTLKQGDAFVCGIHSGKLRALFNDQGKKIKSAGPSIPVEILGMEGIPDAGEAFIVVADEKIARKIAETRHSKERAKALASESKLTLETFLAGKAEGEIKHLNLILKTDVFGSQGAIIDSLNKLSTDEVKVEIVHAGTGAIREADILLAAASKAILIGFNVRPTAKIKDIAEQEQVEIRFYDIIYKLIDDVKNAMAGMLAPIITEQYLGQATVLETFTVPKVGTIAGCMVNDGKLKRNAGIRLLRDGIVIYTGKLSSLKRFKDDAKEVAKGLECGVGLEKFNDIKVGDILDAFEEKEEKATLD